MLVAFEDGRLVAASHGERPPRVLALHGWQRTHRDFDVVLGPTSKPGDPFDGRAIDALALDLPGFGGSLPPPAPWSTAQYAEAIESTLARFEGPAVLLGHSFGGRVAIQLAARLPERVAALVLTGVPFGRPHSAGRTRPAFSYRVVRLARRLNLVDERRLEAARQKYGSADYRAADGVLREVLVRAVNEEYFELLSRIESPIRLVWGERDGVTPLELAQRALPLLQDGELSIVPGAGHLLPLDAPDSLRAALAPWC